MLHLTKTDQNRNQLYLYNLTFAAHSINKIYGKTRNIAFGQKPTAHFGIEIQTLTI